MLKSCNTFALFYMSCACRIPQSISFCMLVISHATNKWWKGEPEYLKLNFTYLCVNRLFLYSRYLDLFHQILFRYKTNHPRQWPRDEFCSSWTLQGECFHFTAFQVEICQVMFTRLCLSCRTIQMKWIIWWHCMSYTSISTNTTIRWDLCLYRNRMFSPLVIIETH